jgi:hypothetical protein
MVVTEFLINYIQQKFDQGSDIANALEKREDVNMTKFMPILQVSENEDAECEKTSYNKHVNNFKREQVMKI